MSSEFIINIFGGQQMKLMEYVCKRCGWRWFPRKEAVKQCPGCRTKLWNKERQVEKNAGKN